MRPRSLLIVAVAGAAMSLALPSRGLWPLLVALVPLFALTANSPRPKGAFWLGFAFGLPFFTLYVWWLPASFASPDFFGSAFWLLYPPLLLILASFWGLVTLTARVLGGRGRPTLALLPPLWILLEWARTQGYFAFPWGTLGYAWLETPIAQLADTVGVWGLSLLSTLVAALLALPFVPSGPGRYGARTDAVGSDDGLPEDEPARRSRRSLAGPGAIAAPLAALLLVAGAWLWGTAKLERELPPADLTALLVQGNIDPFGRLMGPSGEIATQASLSREGAQAASRPPDLVVWPEGAVLTGFGGERGREILAQVQSSSPASVFLVGARVTDEASSFNSAYTIQEGLLVDRYDKHYLVPFGERFPLAEAAAPLYRAVFGLFGLSPLASTSQGQGLGPLESPFGPLAAYICYESVFPQVQRAMVAAGARLLVNITNDAWFARGDGAEQHYAMGSMRAIETRRYLLRAGNDGITGVVDPLGRTVAQLERGQPATMLASFALLDEVTPYVRFGGLLVPLLGLWLVAALLVARVPPR